MSNWFSEGTPESYKIQIIYHEVPAFVKTRLLDTPFRFASYEDAQTLGQEMFNGVQYRIVGSSDKPHWQTTPIEKVMPEALKKKAWYDIYGVAPSKPKQRSQSTQPTQASQSRQARQERQAVETLSKLKPLKVTPNVVSKIEK
jgi:hypothetical protein